MKKVKDIKININKLKLSLNFIEKKVKRYYFLLDNIPTDKINQIFVRNLYYFYVIIEKIKLNLREVTFSRKLLNNKNLNVNAKNKMKLGVRRKCIVSVVLLEHLVALMQKYQIDTYDFEIQSLIDNDEKITLEKIPENYKDVIKEEFESIRTDYNVINDFNINKDGKVVEPLKGLIRKIKRAYNKVKAGLKKAVNFAKDLIKKITNIFKAIWDGIRKIIGMIGKIVKFLFGFLKKFILLLWKLMKMLWEFITVTLPKLLYRAVTFFKYFYIKARKTGTITILMYFLLNIVISKYWDLLFGDLEIQGYSLSDGVPEELSTYPAIILTTYIFWTQTPLLVKIKNFILNKIIKLALSSGKFIFTKILGLPENDRFFTANVSVGKRIELFAAVVFKNLGPFAIRSLLFAMFLKVTGKFAIQKFFKYMPSLREIVLFPIIAIRYIFVMTYRFINNYIMSKN